MSSDNRSAAEGTGLTILHSDIASELCQRCAACCRISILVSNTDSRYRKFLRKIGFTVLPPAKEGEDDCCDGRHDITLDMGYCRHLGQRIENGETIFHCNLYGTSDFPQLCAEFDCVSWAHFTDSYNESNSTLGTAQRALDQLRMRKTVAQVSCHTAVVNPPPVVLRYDPGRTP